MPPNKGVGVGATWQDLRALYFVILIMALETYASNTTLVVFLRGALGTEATPVALGDMQVLQSMASWFEGLAFVTLAAAWLAAWVLLWIAHPWLKRLISATLAISACFYVLDAQFLIWAFGRGSLPVGYEQYLFSSLVALVELAVVSLVFRFPPGRPMLATWEARRASASPRRSHEAP